MKRLIAPPCVARDFDPLADFPEDVTRLVAAAEAAGYRVAPMVAGELWVRYSDGLCAKWLELPNDDARLVHCMLAGAVVVDECESPPKPPAGYASWLDYAVATMDTRTPQVEQLLSDDEVPSREAMLAAARAELSILRQLARLNHPDASGEPVLTGRLPPSTEEPALGA